MSIAVACWIVDAESPLEPTCADVAPSSRPSSTRRRSPGTMRRIVVMSLSVNQSFCTETVRPAYGAWITVSLPM